MKQIVNVVMVSAVLVLLTGTNSNSQVKSQFFPISNEIQIPYGMGELKVTWNSTGIDPDANIYVVYGDEKATLRKETNTTGNNYSDCALTVFNTETEEWKILGSFVDAMKKSNNWLQDENIEKGHTSITYCDGKMYMGTMEFHSMQGPRHRVDELMKKYRGAHLLAYDIASGELKDVTSDMPGGVLFPNQGMISCEALPEYNYVLCFSTPTGDMAIYNTKTSKVDTIIKGPEEMYGFKVFTKFVPTPSGKVYFGFRDYKSTDAFLYVLDLNTMKHSQLMKMPPHIMNGYVYTSDRKQFYAVNMGCDILSINVETDEVKFIGSMIPEAKKEKIRNPNLTGIVLSSDESKIYAVIRQAHDDNFNSDNSNHVLGVSEYNIQTGKATIISDLKDTKNLNINDGYIMGRVSGSGLIDKKGRIYVARNGNLGLIRIDVQN